MSKKIYKYIGPEILKLATTRDGFIGLKCSYPRDYNDPYELFLSVDPNIEPQLLAFYKDSVGSIPQWPTTCFSNSPTIIPMWAHYGHSAKGFVLEFDEEKLEERFEEVSIEDVRYANSANEEISSFLAKAYGTMKPRHTFFLHKMVMYSAYFTKHSCWSYEQERRMVVPPEIIEKNNGDMIFLVPTDCVTAIIAGTKTEYEYCRLAEQVSHSANCVFYRARIGNSFPDMFFKDRDGNMYVFSDESIDKASAVCSTCSEPLTHDNNSRGFCAWCSITEAQSKDAALSNPYRVLQHAGVLENHINSMESIWRKK